MSVARRFAATSDCVLPLKPVLLSIRFDPVSERMRVEQSRDDGAIQHKCKIHVRPHAVYKHH